MMKYSTDTFFQDTGFFQNPTSSQKGSPVFVWLLPLPYTYIKQVCFGHMSCLSSNTAYESLHVSSSEERFGEFETALLMTCQIGVTCLCVSSHDFKERSS